MDWKSWVTDAFGSFGKQPERSLKSFKPEAVDHVRPNVYIQVVINMNQDDHSTTYGTRIQGDVVIEGNVTDAFNTINNIGTAPAQQDLAARLKKLHEEAKQLIKALPADEAEQVSRDLKALVDETTSKKPRREWYEVSAKGLLEAAKSVASMTTPITAAVTAVLAFFKE